MKGDSIIIEEHHRAAAAGVCDILLPALSGASGKYVITVAGESGSGKSETAAAIAERLAKDGIESFIFQQDDYFVYPPRSNDRARREDIGWVGPQEVKLDLMDRHLAQFRDGVSTIDKPLVVYEDDRVDGEQVDVAGARVAIAEGTYTTLLDNVDCHVFIDRSYEQTRAHREKRRRHESELDPFIDRVLAIEHDTISAHKARAQLIVNADYSVSRAG
jgi:uridine kinase